MTQTNPDIGQALPSSQSVDPPQQDKIALSFSRLEPQIAAHDMKMKTSDRQVGISDGSGVRDALSEMIHQIGSLELQIRQLAREIQVLRKDLKRAEKGKEAQQSLVAVLRKEFKRIQGGEEVERSLTRAMRREFKRAREGEEVQQSIVRVLRKELNRIIHGSEEAEQSLVRVLRKELKRAQRATESRQAPPDVAAAHRASSGRFMLNVGRGMWALLPISRIAERYLVSKESALRALRESGLFQADWYLAQNPDVAKAGLDPALHYLSWGAAEGRDPGPNFSTRAYLKANADVAEAKLNPLHHYWNFGRFERRSLGFQAPQKKSNTQIGLKQTATKLDAKLWGGFSEKALLDLEELKQSAKSSRDIASAAWALARWYAAQGDVEKAYENVVLVRSSAKGKKRQEVDLKQRLLEADCLFLSGRREEARAILLAAFDKDTENPDLCLAIAGTYAQDEDEASDELCLVWINRLYEREGLAGIVKRDPAKRLSLNNITARTDGVIPHGSMEKVSVIMPAFNAEETIEFAIQGVLDQTWTNLEIIVVDDCSSDQTYAIAQKFAEADKRVIAIRQPSNQGGYSGRNAALKLVTGEFVTTHDADDWSHPQKIEYQMRVLSQHPDSAAVVGMWARVNDQLYFKGTARASDKKIVMNHSSLLVRRDVLARIGGWDGVRVASDVEFMWRIERHFGKGAIVELPRTAVLAFARENTTSLTRTSRTHLVTRFYGVRREYKEAVEYWHTTAPVDNLVVRDNSGRSFPAPGFILPARNDVVKCDVLFIMDFAMTGGGAFHSTMNYINAALSHGKTVAIFHWRRYDLDVNAPVHRLLRQMAHERRITIVCPGEEVAAKWVIIGYPTMVRTAIDLPPKVKFDTLGVVVNQMAARLRNGDDVQYDPLVVRKNLLELFGREGIWIPISDGVRRLMETDSRYPSPHWQTWTPLIETGRWCQDDRMWRGRVRPEPVIGRHGRDHYTKWPSKKDAVVAAYCAGRSCRVEFLGGGSHAIKVAGHAPANWFIHPFNSVNTQEFLAGLDFFLHYPHEDYIEEFGRAVLEAMAVGLPVILPHVFEETFGSAALYAEPSEVWGLIEKIWRDEQLYLSRVRASREFVLQTGDWKHFAERLSNLHKGPPSRNMPLGAGLRRLIGRPA